MVKGETRRKPTRVPGIERAQQTTDLYPFAPLFRDLLAKFAGVVAKRSSLVKMPKAVNSPPTLSGPM